MGKIEVKRTTAPVPDPPAAVTRRLIPGTVKEHLVKAGFGLLALVVLWTAIATLREAAMELFSGGGRPPGGGMVVSGLKATTAPSYFGPFLACSLALVVGGIVAVWSATDVVGGVRKALGRRLTRLEMLVRQATSALAKAAARVIHLEARNKVVPQLTEIDGAMAKLWVIRDIAEKAASDKSKVRGVWSEEGSVPDMPRTPFQGVLDVGRDAGVLDGPGPALGAGGDAS